MALNVADIPVFILCGGLGTRLKEMTEFRPKPMIPVGPEPILVHIMRHYSHFGFNRFVLCMGYKSEIVRDYFLNFCAMHSDVTVDLKTNSLEVRSVDHSYDWKVTLAYTGELTMTGGRVARAAARYLGNAKHFERQRYGSAFPARLNSASSANSPSRRCGSTPIYAIPQP
jgi:glucose-1-phosphate cytidylyltransferase